MKVFERVVENRLRQILCIDEMQFGFTPGKGTTDAVFILQQIQERYLVKKRDLWMAFVDLEKAASQEMLSGGLSESLEWRSILCQ